MLSCAAAVLALQLVTDATGGPKADIPISIEQARQLSLTAIRSALEMDTAPLSRELVYETEQEWVFYYERADRVPLPGSGWIVTVSKKTGKAEVTAGE